MKEVGLRMTMKGRDMVSPELNKVASNTTRSTRKMESGFKRVQKQVMSTTKLIGSIVAAKVLSRGFAYAEMGIQSLWDTMVGFDQATVTAGARFGEEFYKGTKGAKDLKNAIGAVAEATEFTHEQVALGAKVYAAAGVEGYQAMKMLAGSATLATNAEVEFARAADVSLGMLDAFGLRVKDVTQLQSNMTMVNDILAKVVTSAKLDFEDFTNTMEHSAPIAKSYGDDLENIGVLTGLIAKANIRGTKAGTSLKNMYLGLQGALGSSAKAMKEIGIEAYDPKTNEMRNALDVLIEIKEVTDGMRKDKATQTLKDIFSARGLPGLMSIVQQDTQSLKDYRAEIHKFEGSSKAMATETRKGLANLIAVAKSAASAKGINIIGRLFSESGESPEKTIIAITKRIREFDPTELIRELREVGGVIKSTVSLLWEFREPIKWLIKMNTARRLVGLFMPVSTGATMALGNVKDLKGGIKSLGAMSLMGTPLQLGIAGILLGIHEIIKWKKAQDREEIKTAGKASKGVTALKTGKMDGMTSHELLAKRGRLEKRIEWLKKNTRNSDISNTDIARMSGNMARYGGGGYAGNANLSLASLFGLSNDVDTSRAAKNAQKAEFTKQLALVNAEIEKRVSEQNRDSRSNFVADMREIMKSQQSSMDMNIYFTGLPDGTSATVEASTGGGKSVSVNRVAIGAGAN